MTQDMALGAVIAVAISVVAQYAWDRLFRRGAVLDDHHCSQCKADIVEKIRTEIEERERVDGKLNRVARISRVQTLALLKICQKLDIQGCDRLERMLEEGEGEE